MSVRSNQVAIHVLCSVLFLLFPICSSPDFPHIRIILSNPNGQKEVITHVLLLGFFYFCYFYLIPRFYFRQRYRLFYTWVVVAALAIFAVLFCIHQMNHREEEHHGPAFREQRTGVPDHFPRPHPRHMNLLRMMVFDYSLYLFLIVFSMALLLKTNQRWRQLQQEKLETELSYLKAQINPHFLFNTLNSIYSLAIEQSPYTATAVVKLSGMMRYLISESGRHFVSLEKEISYIDDYIELQQFRLGGTVTIDYQTSGSHRGYEIAPLILITFVENAFKYGVNPEERSAIFIRIFMDKGRLQLIAENNKVTALVSKAEAPGLGISNTRHRLDKLYPGRYQLDIADDKEQFKVSLHLNL